MGKAVAFGDRWKGQEEAARQWRKEESAKTGREIRHMGLSTLSHTREKHCLGYGQICREEGLRPLVLGC